MSAAPLYSVTRAERAVEAVRLRAEGKTARQIASALGVSRSYASMLYVDPDGSKDRARKASYGRDCEDCGTRTDGSNGRAKAPRFCDPCTRKRNEAQHGTLSRYGRGCACDACREANRDHQRSLRGKPAPTHGASGYINYGCRCRKCRDGRLVYDRRRGNEYKKRWVAKVRQSPPPAHVHGTKYGYTVYACRCADCRRANTVANREYRQRQRVAS